MPDLRFPVPKDPDAFVLMPAFCYGGNRLKVLKKGYPPKYTAAEAAPDMEPCQTDIPCLLPDGTGRIEASSGDLSTPCIGVFYPRRRRAVFIFTVPQIDGAYTGISYTQGEITLTCPARRSKIYRFAPPRMEGHPARPIPSDSEIPYRLLEAPCEDLRAFYQIFLKNRKIISLDRTPGRRIPRDRQIAVHLAKFNGMNWREEGEFYAVGTTGHPNQVWQPGWVGGAMTAYAIDVLGSPADRERAFKTLLHLFRHQGESGLVTGGCGIDGVDYSDGFGEAGTENWTLVRKSADVLYFVLRYLMRGGSGDCRITHGVRRCADAFVTLWNKYGQFGLFADAKTGEIAAGGSQSGALAPAGLVLASRYFGEPQYLEAAEASARSMMGQCLQTGSSCGGPGDILHAADSESAFALLESMTVLYEYTRKAEWLTAAEFAAALCGSWVVSYNFPFPEESEFARLGMKTTGTVFANLQNKHSAPGICTLSPRSFYKLSEWTGNPLYRELYDDISGAIPQFMSTKERPILSWDSPPQVLPEGFINERVNMSDWEGPAAMGGVFQGSCWCETANMLTLADSQGE